MRALRKAKADLRKPKTKKPAKKPPAKGAPAGLVSRADAARAFGVAPIRINRWTEDGAPVAVPGSRGHQAYYDLEALRAWRAAKGPREPSQANLNLGEERARLAGAQADRQERENQVRAGELIAKGEAIAEGQKVLAALRARLMRVPTTCVNRGMPREQEALVKAAIIEALRELAAWKLVEESKAS